MPARADAEEILAAERELIPENFSPVKRSPAPLIKALFVKIWTL
jgi:hypothetical protein